MCQIYFVCSGRNFSLLRFGCRSITCRCSNFWTFCTNWDVAGKELSVELAFVDAEGPSEVEEDSVEASVELNVTRNVTGVVNTIEHSVVVLLLFVVDSAVVGDDAKCKVGGIVATMIAKENFSIICFKKVPMIEYH